MSTPTGNAPPRKVGEGDVEITLDGEAKVLKPSAEAARRISTQFGGIQGAIENVMRLDLAAVTAVITLGLGFGGSRPPPKDLGDKIWRTGLTDDSGRLAEYCVTYLRILAMGGRKPAPPTDETEEDGDSKTDPQ